MRVERVFNPDASLGRSRESMATSASGVFEEEKAGVIKSGVMLGGFSPLKGKGKPMYVVLSERAMEIYDTEKAFLKKKPSKLTVDLAIAFNVHNEHFDVKLGKCVCVMRPGDTLLLKAESEQMNQEWFDAILGTAVPARALRLGRFVQPAEFFESVYDVTIVDTPRNKVSHKKGEETPPANIILKYPHITGTRRLCFYAHTIFLCVKNVEPAKENEIPASCIPPFRAVDYFEIQRKFIPNFGYRDNYFILMLGRGSPMGACELWAECENKQTAEHLHHMLNAIIDREAEKKKRLNNGMPVVVPSIPNAPNLANGHRGHRERSHTQPHRSRLASDISQIERRNTNSPLAHLARKTSTGTMACTAGSNRVPPPGPSTTSPSSSSSSSSCLPVPGLRHSFAAPSDVKGKLMAPHLSVFPVRRQSETIKEEATAYQSMDPRDEARKREWDELMRGETIGSRGEGRRAASPSTTRSSADETEDSGGTLRCYGETEDSGGTLKLGGESKPVTPSGSIRNLSMMQQSPRAFVPIQRNSKADHLSSSEDETDADVISAGTNTSTGGESISAGEMDYSHMDVIPWNGVEGSSLSVPSYKDPGSFVSSTDSCYSSMAERQLARGEGGGGERRHNGGAGGRGSSGGGTHHQEQQPPPQFRTYSFGPGHPSYQRPSEMADSKGVASSGDSVDKGSSTGGETAIETNGGSGGVTGNVVGGSSGAKEDARKRAFSLGSKNFFAHFSRPFRKPSTRARHSATSASGASLASSTMSSSTGAPPSSVSSNHISALGHLGGGPASERDDSYRNRSGSFGSGRSTPYSRRSGGGTGGGGSQMDQSRDHLMELDFGGGPPSHHGLGGRCGSGSIGSVESPSRSRTSSFGGNLRKDDHRSDQCEMTFGGGGGGVGGNLGGRSEPPEFIGLTPSQILLMQRAKQPSIDEVVHDGSDYVLTEAPSTTMFAPLQHAAAANSSLAAGGSEQLGYHGGVLDVMGKSHEARSSQYFETIEETTSGRSSRASSLDESATLAEISTRPLGAAIAALDDDYSMMDVSGGVMQMKQPAAAESAAAAAPLLQPMDGGRTTSRSRSTSPCVSSASSSRRRVDSSSTLQSLASCSSDRENSAAAAASTTLTAESTRLNMLQLQPNRQKISTQSEGPGMSGGGILPKRSSVPVLREHDAVTACEPSGAAAAPGSAPLNYAFLQLNKSGPQDSRTRSKSGIIYGGSGKDQLQQPAASVAPAAAAAASSADAEHVEYAVFKPAH